MNSMKRVEDSLQDHICVWLNTGTSLQGNGLKIIISTWVFLVREINKDNPKDRYRRPGNLRDHHVTRKSDYFLIMRNGTFYKPDVNDLEAQIFAIVTKSTPQKNAGILTTCARRDWSILRRKIEEISSTNGVLLKLIQNAAFIVNLDQGNLVWKQDLINKIICKLEMTVRLSSSSMAVNSQLTAGSTALSS